jgi:AraC-like DNA-binding protein
LALMCFQGDGSVVPPAFHGIEKADGVNVETKTGRGRHKAMVARFLKFLAAHPNRPLNLTEICAAISVSERTLRAACEEYLEMGPIRYLTLRRMHQVRRALLDADPSKATVTSVVTDHGFWELGRFSVAYRALFGESPSETLRRAVIKPPPKKASPTPFQKALEETRRLATRERYRYRHVQAIIVAIDQYAEAATGNRDFFLTKPPGLRRGSDMP